jgi:glucose/arabinose dehydrogenase
MSDLNPAARPPQVYHQHVRGILIPAVVAAMLGAWSCSKDPDPPSGPDAPATISGREPIGWDQQAEDAAQLAIFRYAIYVDGARSELADVSCGPGSSPQRFACSGKGPTLPSGSHMLELAAFTPDGESPRSAPLSVMVNPSISNTAPIRWPADATETTPDGVPLRVEKVTEGLDDPVDAAFLPGGALLIAERRGRVRVVEDGVLRADALTLGGESDERILSIAVDPDFDRTHFVFIVQATRTGNGDVFTLARYRELGGTLAQRAVLIEAAAPPAAEAAAVLRTGGDSKLYLAIGAAGFPGTLLRLNLDGTLPRDQAGTAPAVAQGLQAPRGLAADPRSGIFWIADDLGDEAHLSGVSFAGRPLRAEVRARHPLAGGSGSLFFYSSNAVAGFENTMLLASPAGRHIERLRFAADDPARIIASDILLQDVVGPIQVVIAGPDGSIYFCTRDALGRLAGK